MRKTIQVIPASPGTYIHWYNHCHDITVREPLAGWEVTVDREEYEPEQAQVHPMVYMDRAGYAHRFILPDSDHRPGESSIIAIEHPGGKYTDLASTPYDEGRAKVYCVGKGYIHPTNPAMTEGAE